ncbi:hypothetical protein C8R45DRAFT_483312 [Mycena sanguinolenta]|nr:hypothetical protein C8R45DRAFT_483312 [Mycena sanguinolenta]
MAAHILPTVTTKRTPSTQPSVPDKIVMLFNRIARVLSSGFFVLAYLQVGFSVLDTTRKKASRGSTQSSAPSPRASLVMNTKFSWRRRWSIEVPLVSGIMLLNSERMASAHHDAAHRHSLMIRWSCIADNAVAVIHELARNILGLNLSGDGSHRLKRRRLYWV